MQFSLYNEDDYEYFGIVDVPGDLASFITKEAETTGLDPGEYVARIINDIYYILRDSEEAE
jgi:hypothetical protein